MTWKLVYTKHAQKDAKKLVASGLKNKAKSLLETIAKSPDQNDATPSSGMAFRSA